MDPTTPTVNPSPATIGDLALNRIAYATVLSADAAAVAAATATQTADTQANASNDNALGYALAEAGGIGIPQPDGSILAFESNGAGGVATRTLLPPSTPIPTATPANPTQGGTSTSSSPSGLTSTADSSSPPGSATPQSVSSSSPSSGGTNSGLISGTGVATQIGTLIPAGA